MKINIPLIGPVKSGRDAKEPIVASVKAPVAKATSNDILGGMINFNRGGLSNEKTISTRILEANREWVYRNNDVIAQEVAAIEFELYSVDLKGGELEYNKVDDHPVLDILDKFNSRTTKSDGIYMTQSHKKLTGDAFWLLDKNGGVVENIFILPPDKVELVLADPTDASADLIKEYLYKDVIDGKQIQQTYLPEEIIHFKKPNPKNPFRGYGAVEALSDTIDTDTITNEVQRNFFDKGAIGNFVLVSDNNITDEQLKRLKSEMLSAYGGYKNAFKAMIFGNGLKPMDIGFSNKDMDFLNLLEWYRDKIMLGFGNTKASIGIIDDVNRASHESSMAGWLRGTVKPDMNSIVQTINEFLLPIYGDNLVLGFTDPVPQNVTEETDQAVQLKAAGIIQINEARDMVGLDPIDGGDIFEPSSNPTQQDPNNPDEQDPNADSKKQKHFVMVRKKKLPPALRHFDIEPILRSRGLYFRRKINKQLKEEAKPLIRKMIQDSKKKKTPERTISPQFTDEVIDAYYKKQDNIVDIFENQFHDKVLSLLTVVKQEALNNFESEIKSIKGLKKFMAKEKELFDTDDLKVQAQIDLTPILMQELILAGEAAYELIGIEDVYVPYKVQDSVKTMIDKFAESMLETDKQKLAKLITDHIDAGSSISQIRDAIEADFGEYTRMQAERIARTETARISNIAAEDAFIQSGVVEAKQWLLAPGACPKCSPHGGEIVKLKGDFYDSDESGFQDGNPPLHVNCRCKIIPIVKGVDAYRPDTSRQTAEMQNKIKELEAQIDKRTKAFKDMREEYQEKQKDDEVYIKSLEKHLGIDND